MPNGFFADHIVDRKVLADVTQKVEHIDLRHPIKVIDHQRRIVPCKVDKLADLLPDLGDPVRHHLRGVQLPLGGLETRITDQASGASYQRNGSMPGGLKATQHQKRHQRADMEAVSGGIKATIERPRCRGKPFIDGIFTRDLKNQIPGTKII